MFVKFFILFLSIFFIYKFTFPYSSSIGVSMLPSMKEFESFFINKFYYKTIDRGDIIIFKNDDGEQYVKRIIGMPNEKIKLEYGRLIINDSKIKYIKIDSFRYFFENIEYKCEKYFEDISSNNDYLIIDCDKFSPVDHTFEVLIPNDHFYVLGDNRDNSHDSRFDDIGLIKKSSILGKVVLWSDLKTFFSKYNLL